VNSDQGQVTNLLQAWSRGEGAALDEVTPLVYAELRELARVPLCKGDGRRRRQGVAHTRSLLLRHQLLQQIGGVLMHVDALATAAVAAGFA
jgi:hypothetical protein